MRGASPDGQYIRVKLARPVAADGGEGRVLMQESFGGFEPPRLSIRGSGLDSAPTSRGIALLIDGVADPAIGLASERPPLPDQGVMALLVSRRLNVSEWTALLPSGPSGASAPSSASHTSGLSDFRAMASYVKYDIKRPS